MSFAPSFKDHFLALYAGWVKLFFKYIYLNAINSSVKCSSSSDQAKYRITE